MTKFAGQPKQRNVLHKEFKNVVPKKKRERAKGESKKTKSKSKNKRVKKAKRAKTNRVRELQTRKLTVIYICILMIFIRTWAGSPGYWSLY